MEVVYGMYMCVCVCAHMPRLLSEARVLSTMSPLEFSPRQMT